MIASMYSAAEGGFYQRINFSHIFFCLFILWAGLDRPMAQGIQNPVVDFDSVLFVRYTIGYGHVQVMGAKVMHSGGGMYLLTGIKSGNHGIHNVLQMASGLRIISVIGGNGHQGQN